VSKAIALLVGSFLIVGLVIELFTVLFSNLGCQIALGFLVMVGFLVFVWKKAAKVSPTTPEPVVETPQLPSRTSQSAGSLYVPREHPGNR
jgi:hypothetical protein